MERLCPEVTVLDAEGGKVLPGIIDRHVHFNGAGGEGGPRYRTPPLQLSAFVLLRKSAYNLIKTYKFAVVKFLYSYFFQKMKIFLQKKKVLS